MVQVLWEDACCLDDGVWAEIPDVPAVYQPVLVTSVGFLLHQSKGGVIITAAWSPDRTGPRDQIPAGMIHKITFLRPAPGKKGTTL